jgi:2-methylaconitate cis-trans-isomerase PrpF
MRKKITLFILLLFISCAVVIAQTSTINGRVTDNTGQTLPGVSFKAVIIPLTFHQTQHLHFLI